MFRAFAGYLYGLSKGAILPPAPASAAALLPSALLCIRFLVIPYDGGAPYLISTLVPTIGVPVLCALSNNTALE